MAGYRESSFNTFPPFPLNFNSSPPTSILTQYQERQSLPRVIYKRWSNLQTSSKLHRVMSSHFSVHFCTFHAGPVPQRVWTPKGNVALSLVMLRVIDWGGGGEEKKSLVFSFLFQVPSERFPDTDSRSSDSRRNTGFHCAAIREGEKERERE